MKRIDLEHDDLAFGYAIGKAHAIAEWSHRREQRAFRKLCEKLRVAKWYREVKAEGGERWARVLATYRKSCEQYRAKKRAAKLAKLPKVRTCERPGCGTEFPVLFKAGQPRRFCSPSCAKRDLARRRVELDAERQRRHRAEVAKAERPDHPCERCGATLHAVKADGGVARPRRFCSRRCAKRAEADRKRAAWERDNTARSCAHCGATFVPRYQPGQPQRHCSAKCRAAHVRERGSGCT